MTMMETPLDATAKAAALLREHRESIDRRSPHTRTGRDFQ